MKRIETNKNGELIRKDVNYFGGQYSFWEKIKKKGIGSPRIIYEAGIEEFDKIQRNVTGEMGFVNFELLKNGLILRLNLNQRYSCIGIKLDELNSINLVGHRIAITQNKFGKTVTTIVHKGELEIVESNESLKFSIVVKDFEAIKKFFQKDELSKKFNFSISHNPVEKDYSYLLGILDMF